MRRGVVLQALAVGVLLGGVGACVPSLRDDYACGADASCPQGMACQADGRCHELDGDQSAGGDSAGGDPSTGDDERVACLSVGSPCGPGALCCGEPSVCASCPTGADTIECGAGGRCRALSCASGNQACSGACDHWNVLVLSGTQEFFAADVAIGPDGNPRTVARVDDGAGSGRLDLLSWSGDGWLSSTVAPEILDNGSAALALDADGLPRVAYSNRGELVYAVRSASGDWSRVTLASGSFSPRVDIVVDGAGTAHVVSTGPAATGAFRVFDVVGLEGTELGAPSGAASSFVSAALGGAHLIVVYSSGGVLTLATLGTGVWETAPVPLPASANRGGYARVLIDGFGDAHIAFQWRTAVIDGGLAYVRWSGGTFGSVEVVKSCVDCDVSARAGGAMPGIALSSGGEPVVVFLSSDGVGGVWVARREAGTWCAYEQVVSPFDGEFCALATAPSARVHMVYTTSTSQRYGWLDP